MIALLRLLWGWLSGEQDHQDEDALYCDPYHPDRMNPEQLDPQREEPQ